MSCLAAVLEALRARLEGKHPDYVAPVYGSTPAAQSVSLDRTSPEALVAHFQRTTRVERGGLNVPVLFKGHEGYANQRVYPSLAFDIIGTPPRISNYQAHAGKYGGATRYTDIEESREDVYDEDGTLVEASAVRMKEAWQPEMPVDYILEVRALSRDTLSMGRLIQYVYSVLPMRHYLRVAHVNGTFRSWSLILTDTQDLDDRRGVLSGTPGEERENTFVWTYTLEGYLDTTHDTSFVNMVRKRVITVEAGES